MSLTYRLLLFDMNSPVGPLLGPLFRTHGLAQAPWEALAASSHETHCLLPPAKKLALCPASAASRRTFLFIRAPHRPSASKCERLCAALWCSTHHEPPCRTLLFQPRNASLQP